MPYDERMFSETKFKNEIWISLKWKKRMSFWTSALQPINTKWNNKNMYKYLGNIEMELHTLREIIGWLSFLTEIEKLTHLTWMINTQSWMVYTEWAMNTLTLIWLLIESGTCDWLTHKHRRSHIAFKQPRWALNCVQHVFESDIGVLYTCLNMAL